MASQIVTCLHSRMVDLNIEGAPDVSNRHGSGRVRPTRVRITYWYGEDTMEPDAVVRLFGVWTRENGEETDHVIDQAYDSGQRNWPDWLIDLVRSHQP